MPPKKSQPKKTTKDSIRMRIGGAAKTSTIDELEAMLHEVAPMLRALGITHVSPCNLYVPPVDPKGNPVTRVRGQELEDLPIPAPYRSAAEEHGL